jgi:hypothetical protein
MEFVVDHGVVAVAERSEHDNKSMIGGKVHDRRERVAGLGRRRGQPGAPWDGEGRQESAQNE